MAGLAFAVAPRDCDCNGGVLGVRGGVEEPPRWRSSNCEHADPQNDVQNGKRRAGRTGPCAHDASTQAQDNRNVQSSNQLQRVAVGKYRQ